MGSKGKADRAAIAASVMLAEDRRQAPPAADQNAERLAILRGREADDCRWFFTTAKSAIGIHGSNPAGGGLGGSFVESADAKHWSRRTVRHRAAIARERRIHRRLGKLPAAVRFVLELAYEPRQFGPEVSERIGYIANLALALPRAQTAFETYLKAFAPTRKKPHPDSPGEWLVGECRDKQSQRATKFRDEAESVLAAALEAYQAAAPAKGEEEPDTMPEAATAVTAGKRGPYFTAKRAARILAEALGILRKKNRPNRTAADTFLLNI